MIDLKPTGNRLTAVVCALLALLLAAYEALVAVHVIQAGGWRTVDGAFIFAVATIAFILILIALFPIVFFATFAYALIVREQGVRAAANGDDQQAPLVSFQPDRALALRDGEMLTLTRRQIPAQVWKRLIRTTVFVLLVAAMGEALLVALLPALRQLALTATGVGILFPSPALTPSPLDWIVAAFPALVLVLALAALPGEIAKLRGSIIADDRGITTKRTMRRSRFIPWNDMRLFARFVDNRSDAPDGAYMVWGRHHSLTFTIDGPSTRLELGSSSRMPRERYRYDGGFDTYTADARRLLATITVRSYQPLRTFGRVGVILNALRQRFPLYTLTVDDALAAPEAGAPWQPAVDAIAAVPTSNAPLKLRVRLPFFVVLLEALIWFTFLALAMYIYYVTVPDNAFTQYSLASALAGNPFVIMLYAITGSIMALLAAAFAIARRTSRVPGVVATEARLQGRAPGAQPNRQTTTTIPWREIRAWVVLPPSSASAGPTRYLVFSDTNRLTWTETARARLGGFSVRGDRRTAYHARASELHALIAARTDLPLRLFETKREPAR